LKRQNKKLQAATMVEGQGSNAPTDSRTGVRKSIDRLKEARTQKEMAQASKDAVREYLKATGVIKGE
jgi:hypothetical protein